MGYTVTAQIAFYDLNPRICYNYSEKETQTQRPNEVQ